MAPPRFVGKPIIEIHRIRRKAAIEEVVLKTPDTNCVCAINGGGPELLAVAELSLSFDGVKALNRFSCEAVSGEILGLIGPNGAGKTTFFNVINGFLTPDQGHAVFKGKDLIGLPAHRIATLGIARTFQNLRLIGRLSVLENVLLAFPHQPGERLGNLFFRCRDSARSEAENQGVALQLLEEAGIAGKAHSRAEDLSYGQQKLLCLACCLATGAELVLLDEPVAGIAPAMIDQILANISRLPEEGKSVILIEHNLEAVTQICHRVIFMDAGAKVCEGAPGAVRNNPQVIEAYLT